MPGETGRSGVGALSRSPTGTVAVATLLFAVVALLRWNTADLIAVIPVAYTVPIALLAVRFGKWAGLGGGLVAIGLVTAWDVTTDVTVLPAHYTSLAAVFLLAGAGLGWYSDELRREDVRREQAFAELQESQERYRALMEHAPEAIVVLDVEAGGFHDVNGKACLLFELPKAELLGRNPVELSPPVQPDGRPSAPAAAEYVRLATEGVMPVFEWQHRTASGQLVPCEVRLSQLPHPDRVLVRGSITDVTERKRAEQRLAAAEVTEQVAARMSSLIRVTEAALSHLQLKDLLPELAVRVRQILRVDNAGILLVDRAGYLMLETASGLEDSAPRLAPGEGFAGRVAALRRPVTVRGTQVARIALNPSLLQLKSLLGVPLLSGDRLLGVLHVGTLEDREFTAEEVNLLQLAAERAALGIEHANVYEWQQGLVNVLQRSLLPRSLPQIPGIELKARYRPAGYQVGGDFYDVVALRGEQWLLFVGDVCGKGPEAAALTALARYTLRAEAAHEDRPFELLRLLNQALLNEADGGAALLTAVCGVLTPTSPVSTLDVAAAGHPLPLIQRAGGDVELAAAGGGEILGVFPRVSPARLGIELRPGDSVVFYTDGLLDAQAPKTILEPTDLAAKLRGFAGATLEESLAGLERLAVGDQIEPRDDIAILGVRRTPEAERAPHAREPEQAVPRRYGGSHPIGDDPQLAPNLSGGRR